MTDLTSSTHRTMHPLVPVGRRIMPALLAALALALLVGALSPPIHELAEHNVRFHHLQHAALLCGGGILGVLLGRIVRRVAWRLLWVRRAPWQPVALGIVLVGPVIVMLLMAPSTSPWTVEHPLAHVMEHLLLIDLAALIGFSAALLSPAIGWLTVLLLAAMAATFGGMAQEQPSAAPLTAALFVPRQGWAISPAPPRRVCVGTQTWEASIPPGSPARDESAALATT